MSSDHPLNYFNEFYFILCIQVVDPILNIKYPKVISENEIMYIYIYIYVIRDFSGISAWV